MEDTPAPGPPPLAVIPIYYEDLEGLHHESTTLFADTTTTAGWVCLLVLLLFSLSAINGHSDGHHLQSLDVSLTMQSHHS